MSNEAKTWLELADEDFVSAGVLWKNNRYGGAVLFAQQSCEKILKAYVVATKNAPPRKTHRLEWLVKDAELDITEASITEDELAELSKSYFRVRYPDLNNRFYTDRQKVEPLIVSAQKIYQWIAQKLNNR